MRAGHFLYFNNNIIWGENLVPVESIWAPPVAWAAVRSGAVVLLLLTFCLLLLPLWESVIVLCFVVRYFMSILVLQSSWWGGGGLVALLGLSSRCLVMVERLFLAVPRGCLQFAIVVFPDHTHLLFLVNLISKDAHLVFYLSVYPLFQSLN